MDTNRVKQKLLDRQRELEQEIAALKTEASDFDGYEVRDSTDVAQTDRDQSQAFDRATVLTRTLEEVRDALQRIEAGTYGVCIDCGRPIESARLEAAPWTPYCRADQERHDARISAAGSVTL